MVTDVTPVPTKQPELYSSLYICAYIYPEPSNKKHLPNIIRYKFFHE